MYFGAIFQMCEEDVGGCCSCSVVSPGSEQCLLPAALLCLLQPTTRAWGTQGTSFNLLLRLVDSCVVSEPAVTQSLSVSGVSNWSLSVVCMLLSQQQGIQYTCGDHIMGSHD